jgi:hypothetical protein
MDPQLAQIQQHLNAVQAQIDQYHQQRSTTTRHIKTLPPEQQQQAFLLIQKYRNPEEEAQAVEALRDILATVLGRDPSPQELAQGLRIDLGMSGVALNLAVGATVLIGGLTALSGLYSNLFGRESYLQQELGITSASSLARRIFQGTVWLAAAGAVGYGAYRIVEKVAN